jgi:HEPN domain-containing protein
MECIVHFKVIYPQETKMLRGLIILDKGKAPGIHDFTKLFARMGYNVTLSDEKELIFHPVSPKDEYVLDIVRFEMDGDEEHVYQDRELKALLEHLLRK